MWHKEKFVLWMFPLRPSDRDSPVTTHMHLATMHTMHTLHTWHTRRWRGVTTVKYITGSSSWQAWVLGEPATGNFIWRKMEKTPEKLKFTGKRKSYYRYSTIPRSYVGKTTIVTSTEDCQTQTHFDRVSSPGRSAGTQISLTGSDGAISRSPQEQTESKRLDYCSRCYEGKHNVKASGILYKTFHACLQSVGNYV